MKIQSYEAGKLGSSEVDAGVFGGKVLYRTLKDAVVMYHANSRQGTAKVKGRSEVHGSGKKPWKQKHTGRARAGDKKSPLWRGGGTIFGPHPRDFSYHMPIKARRVALRTALFGKLQDGEFTLAALPRGAAPSAKTARKLLADLGLLGGTRASGRALIVLGERDEGVWKSFRNFPGVTVRTADELNAREVVAGGRIIAERAALDALVRRVGIQAEGTQAAGIQAAGIQAGGDR